MSQAREDSIQQDVLDSHLLAMRTRVARRLRAIDLDLRNGGLEIPVRPEEAPIRQRLHRPEHEHLGVGMDELATAVGELQNRVAAIEQDRGKRLEEETR